MSKAKSKKLNLNKETLRNLSNKELSRVIGGRPPPPSYDCTLGKCTGPCTFAPVC